MNETVVPVMTKQSTDLALYAFSKKNIPEGKENFTFKEVKEGGTLKRLFYVGDCTESLLHSVQCLRYRAPYRICPVRSPRYTRRLPGVWYRRARL